MRYVRCGSEAVTERLERTAHYDRRFRCRACGKQFNERTDTVLNRTQYPSDVVALVVLWRLRYKLSLRDLPEMFALRGHGLLLRSRPGLGSQAHACHGRGTAAAPTRQGGPELVC